MKNLEVKIKYNNFEELRENLCLLGATFIENLTQKDIYYVVPIGRLKERVVNGRVELIYYNRPSHAGDKISRYLIWRSLAAIRLARLMLCRKIIVEKNRELWQYKSTRIHLDEVKGLGRFIELETVLAGIDDNNGKRELSHVLSKLDIINKVSMPASYSDMLLAK